MCGIAGWVDFGRDLTQDRAAIVAMTETLRHRGVDASGIWSEGPVTLAHTRTSVIDLPGGIQPMIAQDNGRPIAVVTFNGEIFNFRELRGELESRGHKFRTRSDTEVLLNSYVEWGLDCANHLEGMFAFGIWDLRSESLVLVRDRFGIKPLFYQVLPDGGVIFGSEPKTLLAHPATSAVVDLDGLREVFSTAKQPGQAVFRGQQQVRAGHTLTVSRTGIVEREYWALKAKPHTDDLPTTIGNVRTLLEDIVLEHLEADVPLCTALSGGLDSSAISAIASF